MPTQCASLPYFRLHGKSVAVTWHSIYDVLRQTTKAPSVKPTGRIELFDAAGQRKYLTSEERERFHEATRKQTPEVMTFCLFLYGTGCCTSEALDTLRSRVDFESKAVVIETLKKRRKGVFR